MKHILWPIAGVIIFIIAVGILTQKVQKGQLSLENLITSATPAPQKVVKVKGIAVFVDEAANDKEREKGLSGRTTLADDQGMLFIFDQKGIVPSFWMKDMLIPIDMIWIRNGKVVKIDKNVPIPAPGTPDNKLAIYSPDGQVDYVLEVNAGFSDKNGVVVGDSVDLSGI